ncbi:response regulator [Lebetimonas sp. JH369]|uniref:response regulator n=1 Tax=Lebetimonas sp. JH369 TaxID=990069 RepID=UPI0004667E1C|nr:response regulator [Lebetimonas sp. JH369]
MKITIVENELYLAQSIQNNLSEKLNAKCEIFASYDEAANSNADIFLVNTNLQGNLKNFISNQKEKIIILLAPYVTHSNVTQPIELGADDYIQKPFSIEELIRKINHLKEFYYLKSKTTCYSNFIEYLLKDIEITLPKNISYPLLIKTNFIRAVDKIVFEIAKKENLPIKIIDLNKSDEKDFLNTNTIYYCFNIEKNWQNLPNLFFKRKVIISVSKDFDNILDEFNELDIDYPKKIFLNDEILSIEEYIKFVINNHQHKFPDTELSKKLGISRKSLWENKTNYRIFKQK